MITIIAAILAVAASVAAFISADRWLKASRVVGMAGGVEPRDEVAALNWHLAGVQFGHWESSALNAKAAWWAALAAGLYGVSGLFAALSAVF